MALKIHSSQLFCPIYPNNALCQYIISFTCKKKICMKQAINYFEGLYMYS